MSKVQLETRTFHRRARQLLSHWKTKTEDELYNGADAIMVLVGNVDENNPYQKSTALQTWLLGYEFPQTMLVITPKTLYFVTSQNKASLLNGLRQGDNQVPIEILVRGKDEEQNKKQFKESIIQVIKKSNKGKRLGILPKDKFDGKIVNEWKDAFSEAGAGIEEVDVSGGIAAVLAVKDEEEMKTMRIASRLSTIMMQNFFVEEMTSIIDQEKNVTHEKIAELTESALMDEKQAKKLRIPPDVNLDYLDWCYTPIIQSGGQYDLRSSAVSNEETLHQGTILCSLGVRYKSYCSNLGRTYLIHPSKAQETNYEFLLQLQRRVLDSIRDGVKIKDVYQKAHSYIKAERPELEKHFVKNLGFGIGIEFRESNYTINLKNPRVLKSGMVLNLSIGFQDLENPEPSDSRGKIYSLLIIDTVRVTNDAPILFTECPKNLDGISFFFKDEGGESDKEKQRQKERAEAKQKKPTAILRSKFRSEEQEEETAEKRRREHQKVLANQRQEDGLRRFGEGESISEQKAIVRKFESYKTDAKLPKEVKGLKIVVDTKAETILLPIYGMAVPFHISTLKNISKNDENEFVYLRLNFQTPGQASGKKEDMPFDDPNATFVRALTYRSSDVHRMSEIYKAITDLKKNASKREAERREMADVVVQDKLIEVTGRRPQKLPDVFARPTIDTGKRIPGELEIHSNGLRYQSKVRSDQKIDLLYSNIRHLFFQPCENELVVLLHVHLKNPIMIGKKKTKDIQFYREASDVQFDETGNRRRRHLYGDEDELLAEQEERRRRKQLDREFQTFAEKISDMSGSRVEVDVPFRELGFEGVPFRSNVLLQPTTECLVHLTDPPFLVITLSEVEIAHLERVQFGLKNFDLVFVFRDFSRQPVQINTIPMSQLDNVKEWLDSVDIPFSEGPVNLNWNAIMKTIRDDPQNFFQEGGWAFLNAESDSEDGEQSEESASEFEMSSDEYSGSSSEDSEEYDENASAESGSEEEEEESGEDWDELEEKARRADERKHGVVGGKRRDEDSVDTRKNKKARR
ncbi:uncharacterized protein VTP21DRAFT_3684 [Calcarisporiella thermophila]|uniref:uncharacterized protein n=1 Tax=Calcarisporiella thermophila TaxID=911321 RepID=UPI00374422BB